MKNSFTKTKTGGIKQWILYFIASTVISFSLIFCTLLGVFSGNASHLKNAKAEDKSLKIEQISIKNDYFLKFDDVFSETFESNNFGKLLPEICFEYGNKSIRVENNKAYNLSKTRSDIISGGMVARVKAMNFAYKNGFTKQQSIYYAFPELEDVVESIEKNVYVAPVDAQLEVYENTGKTYISEPQKGIKMNKTRLFEDIFYNFNNYRDNYKFKIITEEIDYNLSKGDYIYNNILRGSFKTYFGSSGESRKNNIKRALSCFDGLTLLPGETLSFNNTTGYRTEDKGYQRAKIIKNGTFIEEFGGGVCQVSTTLYNSALLADLEIVEVHPHSLPVSYIEPCFDAMVNSGSSDLVIKNNTEEPIIIATSYENDFCLVNIYGVKNNYKIVRKSEKTEDLLHFSTETTSDYKAYGLSEPLLAGQSRLISYGKPGYKAVGRLEYYENGVLIKTKQIRTNTYKPTKEVVLVGENP